MTKTYYKDVYGCTASITVHDDSSASLRCCAGHKNTVKGYKNVKSAKSAMSRLSDGWKAV